MVLQDGIKDCGVCSLLSVVRHYGGNVSKEYLMELTSTTKNGVSAYHLIKAAEALGFNSLGMSGEVEEIDEESFPVIAHVVINKSYQHFLVLYHVDHKNKKVLVMDPAKGKRILSLAEFKLMSSGKYIFLKPNKQLPNLMVKKVIFTLFWERVRKDFFPILFILCFSFLYMFFHILTAYHFKYLIEYAIVFQSIENVEKISFFMIGLYFLKEFANVLRNLFLLKWSDIFDFHLTSKILEQIISFPYLYYKNRTTGEILARIKDLGVVKNFITTLLVVSIPEAFSFCIFLLLLFQLHAVLTFYCIFFFLFFLFLHFIFRNPKRKRLKRYLRKEEKINSYLIEIISGFDAIKGLHMEERMFRTWKKKYQKFLKTHYILTFFSYLERLFQNNLHHIMLVLVFLIGSKEVITQNFSLANLLIFQSILTYGTASFYHLLDFFKTYQEAKVSKERVEDLFTIHQESFLMGNYFSFQQLTGKIEIKKLTYSYHSVPLLKEVSLTIPYGRHVFLYGDSGCGKSTLVKMLLQYIKVPFGTISINGIDINHYHLETLRNKIAYVSQNEHLFTDTLLKNIVINRDISMDQIEEVISKMGLSQVVSKSPLGLQMILEENGFNLSGGERQRVVLARSILKVSDIYIFDEATSQIDVTLEREIYLNLFSILAGKTIIVISHRFENQDLFDQVIRLQEGKCYEERG